MPTIAPIETEYKSYCFRSRLESRWAIWMDALGIEWQYEVEGFDLGPAGYYLPDFWLPTDNFWLEIKPTFPPITIKDQIKIDTLDANPISPGLGILVGIGLPDKQEEIRRFWRFSEEEFGKAAKIAKQARFEFGQTPTFEQVHNSAFRPLVKSKAKRRK